MDARANEQSRSGLTGGVFRHLHNSESWPYNLHHAEAPVFLVVLPLAPGSPRVPYHRLIYRHPFVACAIK